MWKNMFRLAFICDILEWILFVLDLLIYQNFNELILSFSIGWAVWGGFCLYKATQIKE